ncbi:unnamed protein product [Urochloa decumbens]|uniref:Uncharacterized protein n=1 Tax=Urochloa decumbens TaxID=240449 RepID=A0ABC9E5Z1_9POAL
MASAAAASEMSSRPGTRTASTSAPETARGTHVFKIAGYSLHRGLGVGKFVRSATFAVGGHDWCLRFYPDGTNSSGNNAASVGLFLELTNPPKAEVIRAVVEFRLVDQATGQSTAFSHPYQVTPVVFARTGNLTWGTLGNKNRSELEASPFLRDDCLVAECHVTVIVTEPRVLQQEPAAAIGRRPGVEVRVQVPPSNLSDNLRRLLEERRGADVTFKVEDEVFHVHKVILATRSPVFEAQLFGPMAEKSTAAGQAIVVEDMQPGVFRALLHFVYTDTMPDDMGELDGGGGGKEMVGHLLVAADRYAMERLKLMCEEILCKSLSVENVAVMLALADQHHCKALGDACAEFVASSDRISNVVASQGYVHLKRVCPVVLVDMMERVAKCLQRCRR